MNATIKPQIIEALNSTGRPGIVKLIEYLELSDYFTAPSSTMYHDESEGGLALHSWYVYRLLAHKNTMLKLNIPNASIIITGLLHDLCKVDTYIMGKKWTKNEATGYKWIQEPVWQVVDMEPLGHGEKSLLIINRYIRLTMEESMMIRWHMGMSEAGVHFRYPTGYAFNRAKELCPGITAIHTADMEAILRTREEIDPEIVEGHRKLYA